MCGGVKYSVSVTRNTAVLFTLACQTLTCGDLMMDGRGICVYFVFWTGLSSWGVSSSGNPSEMGEECRTGAGSLAWVPLVLVCCELTAGWCWGSVRSAAWGWVRMTGLVLAFGWILLGSEPRCGAGSGETSAGAPKQYWSEEHGRPCITALDYSLSRM